MAHKGELKRRLVIVDDESLVRLDLKQRLTERGYLVVGEAATGRGAVAVVRGTQPDLVIMDIKMPDGDGLAAAREIAEEGLAPVLLLSGYSVPALIEQACDAGAMGYLVKPFADAAIEPAIEVALSRAALYRAVRMQNAELRDAVETRPLVDEAKKVLIDRNGLTEEEAFQQIRQLSMRSRKPMREVAEAILLTLRE